MSKYPILPESQPALQMDAEARWMMIWLSPCRLVPDQIVDRYPSLADAAAAMKYLSRVPYPQYIQMRYW